VCGRGIAERARGVDAAADQAQTTRQTGVEHCIACRQFIRRLVRSANGQRSKLEHSRPRSGEPAAEQLLRRQCPVLFVEDWGRDSE
jgi:hypothetical protein